jgi:hypothetical protein
VTAQLEAELLTVGEAGELRVIGGDRQLEVGVVLEVELQAGRDDLEGLGVGASIVLHVDEHPHIGAELVVDGHGRHLLDLGHDPDVRGPTVVVGRAAAGSEREGDHEREQSKQGGSHDP